MLSALEHRREVLPVFQGPLCRVELHVHLDGALRHETIWDMRRQKGMSLPGQGSLAELSHQLFMTHPVDLATFLKPFDLLILPQLRGDLEALERIAWEFCVDEAATGVRYAEVRYAPHLFLPPDLQLNSGSCGTEGWEAARQSAMRSYVGAIQRGFQRAEDQLGVQARSILTIIRGMGEDQPRDIPVMCRELKHLGVVGIDIAGCHETTDEELCRHDALEKAMSDCREQGIPATVHAGEVVTLGKGVEAIEYALDKLGAARIGHGYGAVQCKHLYSRLKRERIHVELCPTSSILTGAIPTVPDDNAVMQMITDDLNYSINTDDPTITGTWLHNEFMLLRRWGLSETHFFRATMNAAKSSFLPGEEKKRLLRDLHRAYGLEAAD